MSNKRELQKLQDQIDQLRFDMENPPKYKEGEKLKDGTVIVDVTKVLFPRNQRFVSGFFFGLDFVDRDFQKYTWSYKGIKNGKIIYVL